MFSETNATILVIDDASESLRLLSVLLQPTYRVLAATSGTTSLRIAGCHPKPELILVDVIMPDMNGFEGITQLRNDPATQDIPVIFLTAMTCAEEHDLQLGVADYITQPIRPLLVLFRVNTQLEAKRAHDGIIDLLTRSAPLHDIGKAGIPDHILSKLGKLMTDEWVVMQTQAKLSRDAIEQAKRDIETRLAFLSATKKITHWRHEKWDGSGYPDNLADNAIPVSARLMAVFDTLSSLRSYKRAIPFKKARDNIAAERGKHLEATLIAHPRWTN